MKPTAAGLIAGMMMAAAGVWLVRSLLVMNWLIAITSFAAVPLLLLCVAPMACLPSAIRAMRADPAETLRAQ